MISFLFILSAKLMFEPIVDAVVTGLSFGIASNILNEGEFLWTMEE